MNGCEFCFLIKETILNKLINIKQIINTINNEELKIAESDKFSLINFHHLLTYLGRPKAEI